MKLNRPIGVLFNKKPDVRKFANDSRLPITDKYIGIEIEAENIQYRNEDLSQLLGYWDVVPDGSLREYGSEFVSTKLRGADIWLALEELERVFKEHKIVPTYSDRTSVHVHVDSRFLTIDHLRVLVLNYLMCEPYLFKYLKHDRENNPYCVPYYKSNLGIQNLSRLFNSNFKFNNLTDIVRVGMKYEAMNIKSIEIKGSIEFRLHYGTNVPLKIFNWVQVLLTLFKLSKETSEHDFFRVFHSKDYKGYLQEIQQYFPYKGDFDLALCEHQANNSITKLLFYANMPRTASKEVSLHWGRTAPTQTVLIDDLEGDD